MWPGHTGPVNGGDVWRMATWNVLAQAYCHPERYGDVDPVALEAGRRRAAVVAEVRRWVDTVDVVCLQEVDDALVDALGEAGVWVHAVAHPGRADGVAVASAVARPTLGGALGDGMSWAGVVLTHPAAPAVATTVVSCHLRHPGDGAVGAAQALALAEQLRAGVPGGEVSGGPVAIGADANATVGGPPTDAWAALGLELVQPSPTAWLSGRARTTDVLALPPGGHLTSVAGPRGPLPTPEWPSDHRLVAGGWPRP